MVHGMGFIRDCESNQEPAKISHPHEVVQGGTECFLCGDGLGGPSAAGYPVIYWFGTTSVIYFHAACAADFVFRLGGDVQQVKHSTDLRLRFVTDGASEAE